MKYSFFLAAIAGLAAAAPAPIELDKRQSGNTANELSGPCRAVTFIFARGSTESGNLVSVLSDAILTSHIYLW